jgi:hypothetical protein
VFVLSFFEVVDVRKLKDQLLYLLGFICAVIRGFIEKYNINMQKT